MDTRKLSKTRSPGIYRLSDGRFVIRWTVKLQTGRRLDREETLTNGSTLEDAIAMRARKVSESRAPTRKPPTFASYVKSWLERRAPTMKPRAAESYTQVLGQWVLPSLGHIRIDHLRRSDIECWVAYVEEWAHRRKRARAPRPYEPIWWVPVSRETLKGWWTKVKQVIRDACAEYDLTDVTLRIRGPKAYGRPRVHEERTLTFPELLEVLGELDLAWRVEVFTDMDSGMRPGELYELRWDLDVDFARDEIEISRSHSNGRVGTTKNNKVKRFPMSELLKSILQAHRKRQIKAQGEALATGLVFPATEKGKTGWRRRASSLRNKLVRAGKRAGIEIRVTPQVLRQTYNTLQRVRGIDKLALLDLMGHSSEDMTAVYFAARDAVRREAVEGFELALGAPLHLVVGEDGS